MNPNTINRSVAGSIPAGLTSERKTRFYGKTNEKLFQL